MTRPTTRVVPVNQSRVPVETPTDFGDFGDPSPRRLAYVSPAAREHEGTAFYLGSADGIDYVGLAVPESAMADDERWASLREVAASLSDLEAGLAVTAAALAAWHARAGFCPACGAQTIPVNAGWVRRCEAEGTDVFPRMDPAVIVAVRDRADRLLLARARHFPPGQVSVLAGFVDAGESLEGAVRREIGEEVGLRLEDIVYLGSQAWPFPSSLMCAFEARAAGTDLSVDPGELAEARWYTRDEFAAAIADGTMRIAPRSAIARSQIERWYTRPLELP
jgi:NAD+ diphosphatase